MPSEGNPVIGLALSGGGARAMAFHLGCLRALYDRGILGKVKVISTVSGGSVIGAAWAYRGGSFEKFDADMVSLLRRGLQGEIVREVFSSWQGPKILATLVFTGLPSIVVTLLLFALSCARKWLGASTKTFEDALASFSRRLPIWGSLTTAFEAALERVLFGKCTVNQVARPGVIAVVNACDLCTGTAFRFGSEKSSGWRYGEIVSPIPTVAKAVAASAAYPILLPPLVEGFEFERLGQKQRATVSLTDGGVFDNLGVAVLEPGRPSELTHAYPVTHIISLNAGAGQLEREEPYWWPSRVVRSFEAVHRKAQDAVYQRLHKYAEAGDIKGFGMIYLGQQDRRLPFVPADLVLRDQVRDYPTDFARMSSRNLDLLSTRGEQLTHLIVEHYLRDLCE